LLFGVILAYGLIIKQSIVFFIAGPFMVTIFYLLKPGQHNKIGIRNLLLSLLLAAVLAYFWYYRVYFDNPQIIPVLVIERFFMADAFGFKIGNPYVPERLLIYLFDTKDYLIGIPGCVLFLLSLPFFLRKNKNFRVKLILILWITIPFIILSLATLKDAHYIISYLPAFAIITATGLTYFRPKIIFRILISLFLLLGFAQYAIYSFGIWPNLGTFLRQTHLNMSWQWLLPKKSDNPAYMAAEYLDRVAGGKITNIGFYYYPGNRPYANSFCSIINLCSSRYKAFDILEHNALDFSDVDCYDYLIFFNSNSPQESSQDSWIDINRYFKQLAACNAFYEPSRHYNYQRIVDISKISEEMVERKYPRQQCISIQKLKYLAGYLPNLELIKTIKGWNISVYIYKNNFRKR
jgi:hypothetical protein